MINLIPEQYRATAKIIALILVVAIIFGAGWTVRGWKDEVAYQALVNDQLATEKKRAEDALAAQQAAMKERDAAQAKVSEADQKYTEDMNNAKKQIDDLRSHLADGRVRVTIPVRSVPGTASCPGSDHAAQRTELDPAFANALAGIASDGDDAIRQLTACQNVLKAVIER